MSSKKGGKTKALKQPIADNKEEASSVMDVVLKYKGSVLKESDLDILRSPSYLNDDIIGFYFTYLTSITETDDILFMHPAVSLLIADIDDDAMVKEILEPLEFCSKNMIFFAVNDSDHWSLLVYDRNLNEFLHHDSMEGSNNVQAMKLYNALKNLVGPGKLSANGKDNIKSKKLNMSKKASVISNSEAPSVSGPPNFKECTTPQQMNGYDCGLVVLAIARTICEWHCSKKKSNANYWFEVKQVDPSIVENSMRSEVMNLIKDLSLGN